MRKLIILTLVTLILLLTLTSCYDSMEITDIASVLFIGIDRGIHDNWRLTFVVSTFPGNGSDSQSGEDTGGAGEAGLKSITVDAPSFFAGLQLANVIIPRTINLMHTQFIVFSEELARKGLIGEFITPIVRYREIRYSVNILISRGKAEDFVNAFHPYVGSEITRTVQDILDIPKLTGYFQSLTLFDLYDCMKSTYHQPIAIYAGLNKGENFVEEGERKENSFSITADYYAGDIPRKGGSPIEILGLALLNGDKMVGKITGHESILLSMVTGRFERGTLTIKDPERPKLIIPVDIKYEKKPKISVNFENDIPVIDITLNLEGDILAIQSRINYEDPKLQPVLKKAVESHIKEGLDNLIKKTQDLNCDALKLGHTAVRCVGTIQEWEEYNWNNHYKDAQITTNVTFNIRRTGSIYESSPIIYSGDEE